MGRLTTDFTPGIWDIQFPASGVFSLTSTANDGQMKFIASVIEDNLADAVILANAKALFQTLHYVVKHFDDDKDDPLLQEDYYHGRMSNAVFERARNCLTMMELEYISVCEKQALLNPKDSDIPFEYDPEKDGRKKTDHA